MNIKSILLSSLLTTIILNGCGSASNSDKNIQPHKVIRQIDPTTVGDMEFSVTNNDKNYHFEFKLDDISKHAQIYIDIDQNIDTGYNPWIEGGVGAEYLMEDGNLFRHAGNGGEDFKWEIVNWGEDNIVSRDISFTTLGDIDIFDVQGVLLDSNWNWDSSSDVNYFTRKEIGTTQPDNSGKQVTREELDEMIKKGEDVTSVDVSEITNMSRLFSHQKHFNQDISNWDVSNVTNMSGIFHNMTNFNQDISNWDVSNVTNMQLMFYGTISFNQDIGNWNVSNVTKMTAMFSKTTNFDQDISNWDVSNVKSMFEMFNDAKSFNQDISNWDVSNVGAKFSFSNHSPLQENYKPDFTKK